MMAFISTDWIDDYMATRGLESSLFRAYLIGLYFSMTTMTTVGYGDLTPTNEKEVGFALCAMIMGGAFYGYAVGTICTIVNNRDLNVSAYHDRMDAVYAWLDYHKLPREIRSRILRYFKLSLSARAATSESDVVRELSPSLRNEVGKLILQDDVKNNPLFDDLPINAVARIQKIMQTIHVEGNQVVVQQGDAGTAMFIVQSGAVQLQRFDVSYDQVISSRVLSKGDSFGEEILTSLREFYGYTVTAIEDSTFLSLDEEEFQNLFEHMPDVRDRITSNAALLFNASTTTDVISDRSLMLRCFRPGQAYAKQWPKTSLREVSDSEIDSW
jgi:hypothetical protein